MKSTISTLLATSIFITLSWSSLNPPMACNISIFCRKFWNDIASRCIDYLTFTEFSAATLYTMALVKLGIPSLWEYLQLCWVDTVTICCSSHFLQPWEKCRTVGRYVSMNSIEEASNLHAKKPPGFHGWHSPHCIHLPNNMQQLLQYWVFDCH